MKRHWPLVAAGAAVLVVALLGALRYVRSQPSGQLSTAGAAALAADGMTPLGGTPAPDFHLVDQRGRAVSLSDFRGKVVVLTGLDPVCWLECPLEAQEMADVNRLLGPELSAKVVLLAVDANPLYHSEADLQAFNRQEHLDGLSNWTFATSSSLRTLQQVWKSYDIEVSVPTNGMVGHSQLIYLIDPQGREQYLSAPESQTDLAWGTSQLLAVYVKRMLGASGPLLSVAPSSLLPTAAAPSLGLPGPVATHFDTPSVGWLVANTPPYQLLYRTTDGGGHFTDLGPAGISQRGGLAWSWPAPGVAWVMVRPFGWMLDAAMYRTGTAGATWGPPAVMDAPPAQGAAAPLAAGGPESAGLLLQSGLWTTADTGASWRMAGPLPPGVGAPALSLAPDGTAWVGGQSSSQADGAQLWRLAPGGGAWRTVSLPAPSQFTGQAVVTEAPTWGAGGHGGVALSAGNGWLWYDMTADGGQHWQVALPPLAVPAPHPVEALGGGVYAICGASRICHGDLASGVWSPVGAAVPAAGLVSVDFVDAAHGWAITAAQAASTLWRTLDGGQSWQRLNPPPPSASPGG